MRLKMLGLPVLLTIVSCTTFGQAGSYFDPAQAYNKILLEKNTGTYIRIGGYKVQGTPYLYGGNQTGAIYKDGLIMDNVYIDYNTYGQQVEVRTAPNAPSTNKDLAMVDSFVLRKGENILEELKFVNAAALGSEEKSFLQVVSKGPKYNLYKKYKSVLGILTSSFNASDLRQFNLETEYFYYNTATKKLAKLKLGRKSFIKEFGQNPEIDSIDFENNTEVELKKFFAFINA